MDTTFKNFLIAVSLLMVVFASTYLAIAYYNPHDCCDEGNTHTVVDSTGAVTDTVCIDSAALTN